MGQRRRLYRAEDKALGAGRFFSSLEAAQGYVDWVIKTKFWRDNSPVRHLRVKYPVFGVMSGAWKFEDEGETRVGVISVGPLSLCEGVLYHELAHIMAWIGGDFDNEAHHQWLFAGAYLAVVRRFWGKEEFLTLKSAFDKKRPPVSYCWPYPPTPEILARATISPPVSEQPKAT